MFLGNVEEFGGFYLKQSWEDTIAVGFSWESQAVENKNMKTINYGF